MEDAGSLPRGPGRAGARRARRRRAPRRRDGARAISATASAPAPTVAYKPGDSPVTAADLAVDRQLAQILRAAFPQAGWLSEETEDDPDRLGRTQALVVDPIDGTRAFMSGDPIWAVSIALVERGEPIAGVVHAPALGETFAASKGRGATLNGAPIRAANLSTLQGARVAGPRPLGRGFRARSSGSSRTPGAAHTLARLPALQRGGRPLRHRSGLDRFARLGHRRRRCHPARGGRRACSRPAEPRISYNTARIRHASSARGAGCHGCRA